MDDMAIDNNKFIKINLDLVNFNSNNNETKLKYDKLYQLSKSKMTNFGNEISNFKLKEFLIKHYVINNLDISENTKEDNLLDIIVSDNVSEDVYIDEVIENPKTGYSYNLFSILMFSILLPFGIFLSIKKIK